MSSCGDDLDLATHRLDPVASASPPSAVRLAFARKQDLRPQKLRELWELWELHHT